MTVHAELQALTMSLNLDGSGERLALLGMQELVVDTLLSPGGGMRVSGQLGNLTAQDTYTVPGSPYEMLGLRAAAQSLLTFEYESPSDAARAASRARAEFDHVLRLKMSSVRVSYWHAAVMHTWDYLQSGVLGALVSATASTVVQAARSVLSAGTDASALALHIEVGSPLVLLPTTAGAADGLQADLGRIGVSNTLERRVEHEGRAFGAAGVETAVLLDCIRVTVEKMQLSARSEGGSEGCSERGGEGSSPTPGEDVRMIRDDVVEVIVERGVGDSAGRPMVVIGSGGELLCQSTKAQYDALMCVVMQNLASKGDARQYERPGRDHEPQSVPASPARSTPARDALRSHYGLSERKKPPPPPPAARRRDDGSKPPLSMRVRFEFRQCSLKLRDPNGPLLAASVRGLGAKLQQHVGGDQEWTLSCARLELTNTRVGADGRGLSRLLWSEDARKNFPSALHLAEAQPPAAADAAPQFNLVYSTEGAIDRKTVVVSLNGTRVALVYSVYLAAADFFYIADAAETPPADETPLAVLSPRTPSRRNSYPPPPPPAEAGRQGSLVLLLSCEETEVMLPRDPSDPKTDGVIARGAFCVKYNALPDHRQLDIEVLQLSVLVGDIGTRGNRSSSGPTAAGLGGSAAVDRAAAILAPADVSFKFNQAHASAPGGARNELAVMSTYELEIAISYQDVKLALAILQNLRDAVPISAEPDSPRSPALAALSQAKASSLVPAAKHSRQQQRVSATSASATVARGVAAAAGASLAGGASTPADDEMNAMVDALSGREMKAMLVAAGLDVTGVVEKSEMREMVRQLAPSQMVRPPPLPPPPEPATQLSLAVQMDGLRLVLINDFNGRNIPLIALMLGTTQLHVSGTADELVLMSDVALSLSAHNPALVAWEPLLEPWRFALQGHFSTLPGVAPSADAPPDAPPPRCTELRVEAEQQCNVSLSFNMCELLTSTLVTLLDDVTGKNKQQEQSPFLPYSLSNQTGVVVRYGRMGTGAVHEHLVPGEEASFDLWGSEDTRNVMCSAEGPPPRSLVVACDGWSWAADVPLHRVGERTIEVTSLAQPELTQRLVCEVGLQADRKVLTLRSSTRLINETRVPLEVRVWQPHQGMETVHPLGADGTLPMPLRPDTGSYRIYLRPIPAATQLEGSYEWSDPCSFPGDDGRSHPPESTALASAGLARGVSAWHCLVHHDGRPERGVCIVRILPPLELINLLARTLRYELRGGGAVASGLLRSGATLAAHEFAAHTSVSMRVQTDGYEPSERALVAVPADVEPEVLCRQINLHDLNHNTLTLSVEYEARRGCVHALSLWAPYWLVNTTGLPLLVREAGSVHGFGGEEPSVVRELVCENQRRGTPFSDFSQDALQTSSVGGSGDVPFSDERMERKYTGLGGVWLPAGWVWLDEAWQLDEGPGRTDAQGWQYASNWSTGWSTECWTMAYVRRRRWVRHRARVAGMSRDAIVLGSDEAYRSMVGRLTGDELRHLVASVGLSHQQCTDTAALQARAWDARTVAREQGGAAGEVIDANAALMPPVQTGRKLELVAPGAAWSAPVPLEAVGTHGLLELPPAARAQGGVRPRGFQLGVSVGWCPGAFGRSKLLTVHHRVLLVNTLASPIACKQHETDAADAVLQPGASVSFHWQRDDAPRLLSLAFLGADADLSVADWSCAFPISDVGDFTVVCRLPRTRAKLFVNVDVQVAGAAITVLFAEQDPKVPPYRVDNLSPYALLVHQTACDELQQPRVIEEVSPGCRVPFAWEQYCREPQLELHVGRGHTSVRLDDLAASGAVHVPPSSDGAPADTLRYRMVADGPVKVLQLLPLHAPPVGQPLRSNYMDDGVLRLNLRLSLASFGLSLVDKHRMGQPEGATELLYLSALGTQLSYQASSGRATLSLLVRHLQVDNQLRAAVFPVLLRPSWSDAETRTHEEARAAGQRSQLPAALEVLVQRNLAAPGVAYYETVSLRLQTMEIMIDYQVRPARPRHAPRDAPLRYTVQLTQRCTL